MVKNTLIINLFGGPGVGKSTLCSMIFSELKLKGISCDFALEYAKDVVWEESFKKLLNQIYIFGKQHNRIWRLNGKVDVIVTDSPLLNSIIYDNDNNKYLYDLVMHEFKKLNSLNYLVTRNLKYETEGRVQTLDEAIEKDIYYNKILIDNKINYKEVLPGSASLNDIMSDILKNINGSK